MMRWIPVPVLLFLLMIFPGCASDSSVVYRSPAHFYYPHCSTYQHSNLPLDSDPPQWRGHEIGPMHAKNIRDLSTKEKRQTVDTVNLINLYNSDPNRSRFWWDRPRFRVVTSP